MPVSRSESRKGYGMPKEIERKFLVDSDKLREACKHVAFPSGSLITQGYLAFEPSVRVRLKEASKAFLTIKGSGLLSRDEFEYEIPRADGEKLIALCPSVITKMRYTLAQVRGKTWEVDEFLDAFKGHYLAEVELLTEDEPFEKPSWVTQEVTEDPRYQNVWLAQHGWPT